MKSLIKLLVSIILVMFATSCNTDELIEETLAGTWEYTIEISFEGTNYNTNQSISETKKFTGSFTWNEELHGWLEGNIEYSYLDGYLDEGYLGFIEDRLMWSENGREYEAFCPWNSVPVKYNTKEFTTKEGSWAWVEITYPNGDEIFCSSVDATFTARKTK